MIYEEIDRPEPDIIAVLKHNGVEVVYTEVDDDLIDSNFECISWHDNRMVISIRSSYLANEIDEYVIDQVERLLGEPPAIYDEETHDFYKQQRMDLSMKFFSESLRQITAAVMIASDPEESSLDSALTKILESGD